jgi:hypothetical protein
MPTISSPRLSETVTPPTQTTKATIEVRRPRAR